MSEAEHRDRVEVAAAKSSLLLLQMAASEAQIGPFARRSRESPEAASRSYRHVSHVAAPGLARTG